MIRQKCHAGNSVASWRKTEISNLVRLMSEDNAHGVKMIFSKLKSMVGKVIAFKRQPKSPASAASRLVKKHLNLKPYLILMVEQAI